MWAIENKTSFEAERTWRRNKEGVHEWVVVVKGTFDIDSNGCLTLADEQLTPLLMPEYSGEPGESSLRYDADLVSPKPTTDIILNATAYAPKNHPSTRFLVSARIGHLHKVIQVHGNRKWGRGTIGSKPSSAEPITELPIVYERAYGGYDHSDSDPKNHRLDTRNPVGCGVANQRLGQCAPNFEYPKGDLKKTGPAGFGAIDSFWSPRREFNGIYDTAWHEKRMPLLPVDWDRRALLCAPADQLPETFLRGGESVELMNLTPEGSLCFDLPNACFEFKTFFGNRIQTHHSNISTVIIEPDHPRVIMVWQTSILCLTDIDYLDKTLVTERKIA